MSSVTFNTINSNRGAGSGSSSSSIWNGRDVVLLTSAERHSLLEAFHSSKKQKISDHVFQFQYQGKTYAIKKISSKHNPIMSRWRDREAVIGPLCRHPNIVTFHGNDTEKWKNFMIMDFVEGQDLDDLCQVFHFSIREQVNDPDLKEEFLRRWDNTKRLVSQVRSALAYLHDNHYLYRDLKGENIRVVIKEGKLEQAVLLDLGAVRHAGTADGLPNGIQTRERNYTFCGNLATMSPEMLRMDGNYTEKIDCWGLGALLYYLLVDEYPFDKYGGEEFKQKVRDEPVELPDWLPVHAKDLINKLLAKNAEQRPSLQEIASHPFFTE